VEITGTSNSIKTYVTVHLVDLYISQDITEDIATGCNATVICGTNLIKFFLHLSIDAKPHGIQITPGAIDISDGKKYQGKQCEGVETHRGMLYP